MELLTELTADFKRELTKNQVKTKNDSVSKLCEHLSEKKGMSLDKD